MSKESIVAKRYARALFEVARERGKTAEIEQELRLIANALDENPDYVKLLEHPNISASEKASMLKQTFGENVSEEVSATLDLLLKKGRQSILRDLFAYYIQIANEASGQAQAQVYTPIPLSEEQSGQIASVFSKIVGKTVRVETILDPSLLGGLQVRIGDRLYDGSLSGKLQRMQKALNEA
jgi:F-type H+-transporting ATPase subunit delta